MQPFLLSCQNWLKGDLLLLCFTRNSALNVWSVLSARRCLTANHSPHAHPKLGTTVTAIPAPADRAGLVNTKELFFPAFVFHASPCLGAHRTQSPEPGIMIELPAIFCLSCLSSLLQLFPHFTPWLPIPSTYHDEYTAFGKYEIFSLHLCNLKACICPFWKQAPSLFPGLGNPSCVAATSSPKPATVVDAQ